MGGFPTYGFGRAGERSRVRMFEEKDNRHDSFRVSGILLFLGKGSRREDLVTRGSVRGEGFCVTVFGRYVSIDGYGEDAAHRGINCAPHV